jgi:hypothetical protein
MRSALRGSRRRARHLPLPEPWRVEDLCAQLAAERSRPIHVFDRPASGDSITAALIATETADYIFCRDDLHGLHRDHAICHELGHLLAGHPDLPEFAAHMRSLSRDAVEAMVLARSCDYGADREREAETIADVIMGRVIEQQTPRDTPRHRILRGFDDALR